MDYKEQKLLDLTHIIIPFSIFFPKNQKFIYDGSEKIPFSMRDALYKSILLDEFVEKLSKI